MGTDEIVRERVGGIFVIFAGWAHISRHLNDVNWVEVDGRVHGFKEIHDRAYKYE